MRCKRSGNKQHASISLYIADAIISQGVSVCRQHANADFLPRGKGEYGYDVYINCRMHCGMMTRSSWEELYCACNTGRRLRFVILGVLVLWARPCPIDLHHDAIYNVLS